MLSEHEILELLEQLKHGVLPGIPGSDQSNPVDPVGHWPVLIGGGVCVNLQAAAALEFNCQPEVISVTRAAIDAISFQDLSTTYQQLHHLSTGIDNRSLIIGYGSNFSSMLSSLQHPDSETNSPGQQSEADVQKYTSNRLYEFSQAIATAVDPGTSIEPNPLAMSFLPLDGPAELNIAGAWCLQLQHRNVKTCFFIGLVNVNAEVAIVGQGSTHEILSICVAPEKISRVSRSGELVVELADPQEISIEETGNRGTYRVAKESSEFTVHSPVVAPADNAPPVPPSLLVQRSLQLSVDDLYLLSVEAIGSANLLSFRFAVEASVLSDSADDLLREGCSYHCLSVNGLPIRHASLSIAEGKFLFKSHE